MSSELRVDKIIPTTGVPTNGGGGIIQIQQTVKTDTWAGDSANNYPNFEEVTGLNVSITPKFSSSKLLVTASISCNSQYWMIMGQLWRGIGSASRSMLESAVADAAGSRPRCTFSELAFSGSTDSYNMYSPTVNFLDSPNSTQTVSYSIALRTYSSSYNAYVNRNHDDRDAADYYGRQISTITVMEVSA